MVPYWYVEVLLYISGTTNNLHYRSPKDYDLDRHYFLPTHSRGRPDIDFIELGETYQPS